MKFIISAFFSNQVKYTLSITELYAPNNPLLSALVLFSLFSLAGSIGLLIGTFYQRFNNWVHLMTFGIIIVSPSLIGLTLYHGGANFRNTIFMFFKTILGINKDSFNPIILMGTLLVITSIILIPSFLMNKTMEIQRVNA
ncbi:hypothetical protein [Vagococcus fluvialis]|uniref:hypothetical protein n=1 Tax=Vagococcus fluvialis TaxID=2738 RepID=UPI001A900687|nr:hypothetical protein [Vagococcus fluvialis]MBO0438181.1 hypothetical protein [Vagococcus fluvialis]